MFNPGSRRRPTNAIALGGHQLVVTLLVAVIVLAEAIPLAVTSDTGATPPAATPAFQEDPCEAEEFAGARCGTVEVPVDWSPPEGDTIDLALVVRPADDPGARIGALLLNNGSGRSAIEQLRLALQNGTIEGTVITDSFDLVAVDPRGVGQSVPIECGRPLRGEGVSYFPQDEQAFDAMVADNRALVEACRQGPGGAMLDYLDLETSARDLDAVRRALGEEQVDFYGIEHTTLVGRTYARLFPGQLRQMTLDTSLDDTAPAVQRLADEVVAVETALNRFAAWCAETPDCALYGQDVLGRFDALVAQADTTPIPAGDRAPMTGEDIRRSVQDQLVLRFTWPGFAAAIEQAAAGDASALARLPDQTRDPVQDHAVRCATTPPAATSFAEFQALEQMVRQLAPRTGGASGAWDTAAGCIGWPGRPAQPDSGEPAVGAPATLFVASTNNTLGHYPNAFNLARQLPGSMVLSRPGDDYSLINLSPCVGAAFATYATTGQLPAPGALCPE